MALRTQPRKILSHCTFFDKPRCLSSKPRPEVMLPEVVIPEADMKERVARSLIEGEPEVTLSSEVVLPEAEAALSVVWSCNEWDPLEEVIVGTPEGAVVPPLSQTIKATCPQTSWQFFLQNGGQLYPKHFIDKCHVEELCRILTAEGLTVRRPEVLDFTREFSTPDVAATGFNAANPRDSLLVVGNEIIESPMTWRCRYYEYLAYRPLVRHYFRQGARWSQAPKATLKDDLYVKHIRCTWRPRGFVLMLDPTRVLVEKDEINMHKLFHKLGIHVIKVPFRHAYTFGGGLHCWTADIRRRGKMESYM